MHDEKEIIRELHISAIFTIIVDENSLEDMKIARIAISGPPSSHSTRDLLFSQKKRFYAQSHFPFATHIY
jgi:hypothetical protein